MKKILFFIISVFLISCSSKRQETSADNLSAKEKKIVNDFLEFELKRDRYKSYKNFEYVIIEEALKKTKPLSAYEFNFKYKNSRGSHIKHWILDSLQVEKLKVALDKEEIYHWKTTDFKNIKVSLLKDEELARIIKKSEYIHLPEKLIIYLSRPLLVDKNNALISFDIGNGQLGLAAITHFTALMTKKEGKWVKSAHFEDGVYY